jgi:uncharacterized membrane protein
MFISLKAGEWLLIILIGLVILLLGILFFNYVPFPSPGSEASLISPQAWPVLLCLMPLVLFAAVIFSVSGILAGRRRAEGRRGLKTERRIMVASGGIFVGLVLLSIFAFLFG